MEELWGTDSKIKTKTNIKKSLYTANIKHVCVMYLTIEISVQSEDIIIQIYFRCYNHVV